MKDGLKLVVILVVGVSIGCRPSEPDRMAELGKVDFVVAGDVRVTAADAYTAAMIFSRIGEIAGRKTDAATITNRINSMAVKAVPSLLSSKLIAAELDRRDIRPTAEAKQRVLDRYRQRTRQKKVSLDELAVRFGPFEKAFRHQFEFESRLETFLSSQEECQVTDEEIEIAEAQGKQVNAKAKADNERAKKRGEEAWNRLNAGESWENVAKAYSEDKLLYGPNCNYDKEWETFPLKEFYLKELAEALKETKVGAYTKPIDTDEGLIIAKVLSIKDNCYECVRILIRLRTFEDIVSREERKVLLQRVKRRDFQLDLLKELKAARTISYPLGTNFTYMVWQ